METQICTWCQVEKPITDYRRRNDHPKSGVKAGYEKSCKQCRDAKHQKNMEEGRTKVLALKNNPCVDCGIQLPAEVMEFDHVFGPPKRSASGKKLKFIDLAGSPNVLKIELAKCELRCPNCHALRHYREGYSW